MRQQQFSLEVFADYHQFYLWDAGTDPEAPIDYTEDDMSRRIKAGPGVVAILPARNTTVPVELEVHDTDPGFEAHEWDHIAEASLRLATGSLQVHECTGGSVADVRVSPGWYRVRSLSGQLATLSEDGLSGNDHYRVILWPAAQADIRVIKQWQWL